MCCGKLKYAREMIADRYGIRTVAIATDAYGKVVAADAKRAATKMLERKDWRRRCVAALSLTDTRTLLAGLRPLAAGRW